jgi:RNA polymerase sigma-70 factor (ECF subfamily)
MTAPSAIPSGRPQPAPSPEPLGQLEEGALVERVRARDPLAFDELVRRYVRRAFAVAYHVMQHREDAEDLVQDAFIAVLEQIDRFEPGRSFAPWFFRVLVNRGLNARKSRRVRRTEAVPEDAAAVSRSPHRDAEDAEFRTRLRGALRSLPERQRLVVRLAELEGFSTAEIAGIMNVAQSTVRWYLHEARRALRVALAPLEDDVRGR